MGTKVALHHRTQYCYDKLVSLGPQVIQLRPAPHCRTPILGYSLQITPGNHVLKWLLDPYANHLARVLFAEKTVEFTVEVEVVADLTPINPFSFLLEPGCETFPFVYSEELTSALKPYCMTVPAGPLLGSFLTAVNATDERGTVAFLGDLNTRVRHEIAYVTRLEHGVQTSEETLSLRRGSCRDSAWLLVEVCRHLGIAARFASGYLVQLAPDEKPDAYLPGDPSGLSVDSVDLHAWTEVYLPGAGWIGLDPTSGLFTAEGHIPLVCTPSAAQAAAISGTVEPSGIEFNVSMSVQRLDEQPRLAKPYSDETWAKVQQVAHHIDHEIESADIRMTMGGEPTYVGIDERESPQWHLEALGALKRARGLALIRRLRERTAPGGLLHFAQGKWYPGEALPRWALHCISRKDGVPVWENAALIADENEQYGLSPGDALTFLQALARRLEVSTGNILPAFSYEATDSVDQAAGYVLPLRRRQPGGKLAWSSQLWFPRPNHLGLSPGDSPLGYRIPVEAIPWVAPDELVYEHEAAPFSDRIRLPLRPARQPELFGSEPSPDSLPPHPSTAVSATELIRPSLCVQVREGRMHVFLPYVPVIADYLDLVAAVEDTCQHLKNSVWVEGYTPPLDPRIRSFSLTPDPGVLEVNLPPTSTWDELEETVAILDEEAHSNRLTNAKFGYDGTHLATGGGSHIVIGGATVADSPFLRRPDLLCSMVAFWQHHPSLSYLFSGMYVGPTSQYPRVDEARVDALYELEVSFSQLPERDCPPWILDGLFRNLLVDVTGNTHRAEFCIDKMYPPPGTGLQLGLLELRAFEMAPHFRMGLMEMLLVRALICMLWKRPIDGSLVRWGTALHDRYMLPHFVELDMVHVLDELRGSGYAFEDAWFASHLRFRFPKIGSITANGVELELRQALEPWNVLAEEATSAGTGRSVDSSLERMQIKVTGSTTPSRYVVACNGRRVPLHPVEGAGEKPGQAIAGIRYRARRLSAALHPTVPVHSPLTFDLIDTWKEHVVGRCVYHVGHPDGGLYPSLPTDAADAASRRGERFVVAKPASGRATVPAAENNPVFPMTLDLRWPAKAKEIRGTEVPPAEAIDNQPGRIA